MNGERERLAAMTVGGSQWGRWDAERTERECTSTGWDAEREGRSVGSCRERPIEIHGRRGKWQRIAWILNHLSLSLLLTTRALPPCRPSSAPRLLAFTTFDESDDIRFSFPGLHLSYSLLLFPYSTFCSSFPPNTLEWIPGE